MNLKELCALLGLPESASWDEVKTELNRMRSGLKEGAEKVTELNTKIEELSEKNKELDEKAKSVNTSHHAPTLDKFVPRGDYDRVMQRAQEAEKKIKEQEDASRNAEIDTEIEKALQAQKITPATVDYHKAQCMQEGGLDRFRAFVEAAPVIAGESGLDKKKAQNGSKSKLTAEQRQICRNMGITEEQFLSVEED